LQTLEEGLVQKLARIERVFLFMPLEHAEDLALQRLSVKLFAQLQDEAPPHLHDQFGYYLDYARQHHDIIERFGRFPHRNATLGRASTAAELAFLEQPGSRF
jgi:uncharacterized protein (DUF924 family)